MTVFWVALGGALGAVGRYSMSLIVVGVTATLMVNVVGSFLIGLAFVLLWEKGLDRFMPFVVTGVLGGFTTFSAFSLDAFRLFEDGRMSEAVFYVFGSVVLSISAAVFAIWLARGLTA
ncbi:MAG: CrcB family protein [Pseudomonadota bacterium]